MLRGLFRGLRKDHVDLIARAYAKNSVRGGSGLIFTFIALAIGLTIAASFVYLLETIDTLGKKAGAQAGQDLSGEVFGTVDKLNELYGKEIIQGLIDADDEQAKYLTHTKPVMISAILLGLLIAVPFLAALGAFNQLSGDIQNKGLRYLLLRTERVNIIVGRFIGTYLYTCIVLFILMAIILLYMLAKIRFYGAGDMALWIAQGYLAMILLALPYVALCTFLSAIFDSPFLTMFISQGVTGILPLIVWGGTRVEKKIEYVNYVMPWGYKYHLLHPDMLHVLGAAGIMLAFTALFLFLGVRTFHKRDL